MTKVESGQLKSGTETNQLAGANQPVRQASIIAGVGLLLMAILAPFTEFVVLADLVTPGDAAQTATAISGAEVLFRLGIVSLFVVAILDVVVAWALYAVLKPVNNGLSLLAAVFRLVYTGVLLVAISELVGVLQLLNDAGSSAVLSADQLTAEVLRGIETFYLVRDVGFVLFGVHLLLLGYLAYRSGYVPSVVGILLVIAGLGYATDSVGPVLSDRYTIELTMVAFVGEVLLLLWLLVKGRHIEVNNMGATRAVERLESSESDQ